MSVHQSGYGGSATIATGPQSLQVAIESWTLTVATGVIEAYAKGELYKTKFAGPGEWEAVIVGLLQDDAIAGDILAPPGDTIATMVLVINATDKITGVTGIVTNWVVDDPLDGPVRVTGTITGTAGGAGDLTATIA